MDFVELDPDQSREMVNSRQRFQALRDAEARTRDFRGSMTWSTTKERDYLLRSAYDKTGRRRQVSLGPRTEDSERIKDQFELGRARASARLAELRQVMARQSSINRALGLARMPMMGARLLRALDRAGLLGTGIRVLGTNALYAYEAVAGLHLSSDILTTEDVDLLLDSRKRLTMVATDAIEETSLIALLRKVDPSFERTRQRFRATNKDGYLVDLIKPLREPPWGRDRGTVEPDDPSDLEAVEIAGLSWHESAPAFEAIAIDQRGEPLRIVASDPRVFAAHKLWLSGRADRDPIKRRRDNAQATAVAALVATYFPHLVYEAADLRMLPKPVFEAARPLFRPRDADGS